MNQQHFTIAWYSPLLEIEQNPSDDKFTDQKIREYNAGSHLALAQSLKKKQPMLVGIIRPDNTDFDIVIAPQSSVEQGLDKHGRPLVNPIFVQLKDIYLHNQQKELSASEWINLIHEKYLNHDLTLQYNSAEKRGTLHLVNKVHVQFPMIDPESLLKTIVVPRTSFEQVTIAVGIGTAAHVWQLYPSVKYFGAVSSRVIEELKEIYN